MTVPSATRPGPRGLSPIHVSLLLVPGYVIGAGARSRAFTTGLHAACYASVGFMVLAAVLSAIRAKGSTRPAAASPD